MDIFKETNVCILSTVFFGVDKIHFKLYFLAMADLMEAMVDTDPMEDMADMVDMAMASKGLLSQSSSFKCYAVLKSNQDNDIN